MIAAPGGAGSIVRKLVLVALFLTVSRVQAQPILELAGPAVASGPEFERIRGVRELADGSVLISDRQRNALLHLASMRSSPVVIGRIGAGPGEYRVAGDLWPLSGDTSLFTDQYSGRWLLLSGVRIVGTLPESRPGNLAVRGLTQGATRLGEVVALRRFGEGNPRVRIESASDSFVVVRARITSDLVDSLAVIAGAGADGFAVLPERAGRPSYVLPVNPLAAAEHVLMQRDGWMAVVRLSPYRVDWRRPDDSWIRGAALPRTTRRVGRDEQCAAIERAFSASWPCDPSEFKGWPEFVPPVRWFNPHFEEPSLLSLPQGRVAIARTPLPPDKRRRYDIVDRRGTLVAVLALSLSEVLVGSSARHAYVAWTDEDGLQSLRRYDWPVVLRESAP